MPKLPSVSGMQAVVAFRKVGFILDRAKGSHHVLEREGWPTRLSIPIHGNKALKMGTLRSLIRDAGLSVAEFVALL